MSLDVEVLVDPFSGTSNERFPSSQSIYALSLCIYKKKKKKKIEGIFMAIEMDERESLVDLSGHDDCKTRHRKSTKKVIHLLH